MVCRSRLQIAPTLLYLVIALRDMTQPMHFLVEKKNHIAEKLQDARDEVQNFYNFLIKEHFTSWS